MKTTHPTPPHDDGAAFTSHVVRRIQKAPGDKPLQGADAVGPETQKPHADPTRYGDWERNGLCVDF